MKAWEEFLLKLELKLGKNTVDRWIRSMSTIRFDARNLYLQASDPIQVAWFEEHIRPFLKQGLLCHNDKTIQVHLSLQTSPSYQNSPKSGATNKEESKPTFSIHPDRLDPENSFDTFVSNPDNIVALKLLKDPLQMEFNPVFIYGPKSCGKTHLLQASAQLLQSLGKKIFYIRAETFTSHVIQAIRLGLMINFRAIYRNIDALFIDDIDFLARKDATQEEFFHTFNTLHTLGKKIFLTASVPPSKLQEIEPRLISRFEWGISIGMKPSSAIQILEKKASLWKFSLDPKVLEFLAETFPNDPVKALQALSIRTQGLSSITKEKASQYLQDMIAKSNTKILTFESIVEKTATHFGIKPDDILGKSQAREFAYPRQIAMFIIRENLKLPFQRMGEIFGRDHSTVMSSIKQIQKMNEDKNGSSVEDVSKICKSLLTTYGNV